jgi:hypothetical protein
VLVLIAVGIATTAMKVPCRDSFVASMLQTVNAYFFCTRGSVSLVVCTSCMECSGGATNSRTTLFLYNFKTFANLNLETYNTLILETKA